MWISRALGVMITGLVRLILHFCISVYGTSKIIGSTIAPPTLPVPMPTTSYRSVKLYYRSMTSLYTTVVMIFPVSKHEY